MYWPVGAPRIYSESISPDGAFHKPSNDAESRETTEDSESLTNGSRIGADDNDELVSGSTSGLPSPIRSEVAPVESDSRSVAQAQLTASSRSIRRQDNAILSIRLSKAGLLFAVITATSLTIWQTKPTVILASVLRSSKSLETYGKNVALLVRPDSTVYVIQTTNGYLITYSLATDPDARVYKPRFESYASGQTRRNSNFGGVRGQGEDRILWGSGEGSGAREVSLRFRMVIKVDAGIGNALTLDNELVVATQKPAAVQCIRWTPDNNGNQTSTELFSRMEWLQKKSIVTQMIHDRPMSLSAWITNDGRAYAVQRLSHHKEADDPLRLFRGFCFHEPSGPEGIATKAAINARFSLIAVGCRDGTIQVYTARDYAGNIPLSHTHQLPVSRETCGALRCLVYSPDGYCLFGGFEHGWATWSVFGKAGANSFGADRRVSEDHDEGWLESVYEAVWIGGGCEILMLGRRDDRIWSMEMARSALTGCYTPANIFRTLLQTSSSVMMYRGYDVPDLMTISAESSLWHTSRIPASYLVDQWPIRCSVISPDSRYVAVAGQRGLAHYSFNSGRWKTFVNEHMENEFQVRGGMAWHQHVLVAAIDAGGSFELRLFSRESALDSTAMLHVQSLPAPIVLIACSGEDSLLVYTHENLLYHFIFTAAETSISLVQVGQIAFHGIVRSPARVRALSWLLPDEQILEGDPSQDVAVATVLFLVDGKLVLLQPSLGEDGNLKYDMRIIAQNVEYFALMRDQHRPSTLQVNGLGVANVQSGQEHDNSLRDSLWTFEGTDMKAWTDVHDVLQSAPSELGRELPPTVSVAVDFYPLSIILEKGIILGLESDLVQRRNINFAFSKFTTRTHLFIPQILRLYLSQFHSSAALHLAQHYKELEYFAHALEVLLHDVLDDEADTTPSPEVALLPSVLSLLSSFPQYLEIIVQCTRKTEVRSWRTLFSHLPPPQALFEESLQKSSLKTAGGYLIILNTLEESSSSSEQLLRLLARAKEEQDWDLCKELARFLMALDESGKTLIDAVERVGLRHPAQRQKSGPVSASLAAPPRSQSLENGVGMGISQASSSAGSVSPRNESPTDYFLSGGD